MNCTVETMIFPLIIPTYVKSCCFFSFFPFVAAQCWFPISSYENELDIIFSYKDCGIQMKEGSLSTVLSQVSQQIHEWDHLVGGCFGVKWFQNMRGVPSIMVCWAGWRTILTLYLFSMIILLREKCQLTFLSFCGSLLLSPLPELTY